MGCNCNLKKVSFGLAIIHILLGAFGAFFTIAFLAIPKSERDWKRIGDDKTWVTVICVAYTLYFLLLVAGASAVIVGLKKNRSQLLHIFIYIAYLGICVTFGLSIRMMIRNIRQKKAAGPIALEFFIDLCCCAFQGVILYPIYVQYKRMRMTPVLPTQHTLDNTGRYLPQQNTLASNQTIQKQY